MKSLFFVGVIVLSVLSGINETATFFESNRLRRLVYQQQQTPPQQIPPQQIPPQQIPPQQIPHILTCTNNEDCGGGEWCRQTSLHSTPIKECVPYAAEGESCGGYLVHGRCAPGKTCADLHPCMWDEPGICATPCESGYGFNSNGECTQICGTTLGLTCDIGYKCEYGFCCDPANGQIGKKYIDCNMVNCIAAPCSIDNGGCKDGQLCTNNYCNGCNAVCDKCPQDKYCIDGSGNCVRGNIWYCKMDPCQLNNGGCTDEQDCMSNYCNGCNAICVQKGGQKRKAGCKSGCK